MERCLRPGRVWQYGRTWSRSTAQHLPESGIECAETAELRLRRALLGLASRGTVTLRRLPRRMRHDVRQRSVLREEHERAQQLS